MKKTSTNSPSIVSDISAIAGLYKTVIWMLSQRLQRGPDWEARLEDDAMRVIALERPQDERVRVHQN